MSPRRAPDAAEQGAEPRPGPRPDHRSEPATGGRRRSSPAIVVVIVVLVAAAALAAVATVGRSQATTATAKTTVPLQAVPVVKRDLATYTSANGTLGYGAVVTISEGGSSSTASSGASGAASPSSSSGTGSGSSGGAGASGGSGATSGASPSSSSATATTALVTSSNTVTRLVDEGATVTRGQDLYAVDNQPRVLFYGGTPEWRDLSALSTPGVDVLELEQNLVSLGYDPDGRITIDETFDDATTVAVERWQQQHGYDQTGTVKLGQIVYLPGPSRVGTHHAEVGAIARAGTAVTEVTVLTTVETVYGGPGIVSGVPAPGTALKAGAELARIDGRPVVALSGSTAIGRELKLGVADGDDVRVLKQNLLDLGYDPSHTFTINGVFDQATADAVNRFKAAHQADQDGVVPLGSVVVVPDGLSVGTHLADDGAAVAADTPVVELVASHRQVTTTIAVTDRGSLQAGDEVQLVFPDNATKVGHVQSVGSVASKDARNANATPTVPVVITLSEADIDPNLVSTPVTVNFVKDQAKGVLAVPTAALVALKEGGFAVQVADAGGGSHLVGVQTGLYADSYVQISGDGISESTRVMVAA